MRAESGSPMMQGTSREVAAEFLGTFILIVFGVGVVAQTVLSANANGSFLAINIGWGLAVMLGVYVAGARLGRAPESRRHDCPGGLRGFSWSKVAPYIVAQMAGAFVASAVVYLTYGEAFEAFDSGVRQIAGPQGTAGHFCDLSSAISVTLGGFVDQVVGTGLLMLAILAVTDTRNAATPSG